MNLRTLIFLLSIVIVGQITAAPDSAKKSFAEEFRRYQERGHTTAEASAYMRAFLDGYLQAIGGETNMNVSKFDDTITAYFDAGEKPDKTALIQPLFRGLIAEQLSPAKLKIISYVIQKEPELLDEKPLRRENQLTALGLAANMGEIGVVKDLLNVAAKTE